MISVIHTRPSCWGQDVESGSLDLRYVPIGFPDHRLRKGDPAGDNMGEVCTGEGRDMLVDAFKKCKPDIFLFWTHFGEFTPKLLGRLRKVSPRTVFVHGSGNQILGPRKVCWYIHKYRKHIDAVLTSTTDRKRKALFGKWVKWVGTLWTFGFDPSAFTLSDDEMEYDCFFGGGDSTKSGRGIGRFPYSKFRYDLVAGVAKHHTILVRGGGMWLENGVPAKPGIADGLAYFREMQKARIVLGTYHDDLERRYSKRTVYGGASGRLFATRYIPGMEKDFKNHENIVWFRSVDEGLELIDHYLSHNDERERVARQTRKHFVKHHSWKARLREFEALVPRVLAAVGRRAGD